MSVARLVLPASADGSPEWLAQRTRGIGGTDVANLYTGAESPFQMWRIKRGLTEPERPSPELQALFDYGHSREPVLARIFAERTGERVRNTGTWVRKDQPWAYANPDRLVGTDGLLEIKTTGPFTDAAKDWKAGRVHAKAWIQAHWYAHVTGRHRLWFIAEVDRQPIILGPYDADTGLIEELVELAADFWSRVEDGQEPDPEPRDAAIAYPVATDREHVLDPWSETHADLDRIRVIDQQIRELERERAHLVEGIQLEMGDAEALVDTTGKVLVTWKNTAGRRSLSKDALVEAGLDPDDYIRTGKPSRRFTIKENS